MKRFFVVMLFACAAVCAVQAQVVDTDVCAILKNPASFDGKIVRVKATVSLGFDQFILRGEDCGQPVDGIWLAYPAGAKGKAAPNAILKLQPAHNFAGKYTEPTRTPVTLEKDKEFKQFDSLLTQTHSYGPGICMGCAKYEVSATLVGRLDGVADANLERDASGKIVGLGGFGNLNAYPARLVLQSVSDVTPKAVDYSKADKETSGETFTTAGQLDDPIASARRMAGMVAAVMGGSPAAAQAKKDADMYPKPGEQNGVIVKFGSTSEAWIKDEGVGQEDSPDGVLYDCTFNSDHMQSEEELKGILHMGQHISDLRNPQNPHIQPPLYFLEFDAWAITVTSAVGTRQKFLTLPGGYVAWDYKWPSTQVTQDFEGTVKEFLAKEALLSQ